MGVLPLALWNKNLLLAATDYYNKWVEAKPLAQIKEVDTIKFVTKTSYPCLATLKLLYKTMECSSRTKKSKWYSTSLGLNYKIQRRVTLSATGKPRWPTRRSWAISKGDFKKPKANGSSSNQTFCGPIGPHREKQRMKCPIPWLLVSKL